MIIRKDKIRHESLLINSLYFLALMCLLRFFKAAEMLVLICGQCPSVLTKFNFKTIEMFDKYNNNKSVASQFNSILINPRHHKSKPTF